MTELADTAAASGQFNESDAASYENSLLFYARGDKDHLGNFWAFRNIVRPTMLRAWWQEDVAARLMQFYLDFKAGKRPKIILEAPPQHGKSEQVRDFVAWLFGIDPELRVIFASYSDELGTFTNTSLQRMLVSEQYQSVFYKTYLARVGARDPAGARRTHNLIEFVGHKGSFRNTTVEGQITGFGLDIGIVDDPIKGRAESMYKSTRDKVWSWLTDDFMSRFSDKAGMIMIMTRWHVDDPAGRWLERFPEIDEIKYQAIADPDDWTVKAGYRKAGVPLFEQHKTLEFLQSYRRTLTEASWVSLYQQSPIISGGGVIPIDKLRILPSWQRHNNKDIKKSVRYIDKAGSQDEGAYTAGVLMHSMVDGTYVISHVFRGQWSARDREYKIKQYCEADKVMLKTGYEVWIEQEPGSGGKESAENTIRNLAGLKVTADKVTGKKEVRAEPFVAQCQGDNVRLVGGDWVIAFREEAELWPVGKYMDQIDAAAGAFNKLTAHPIYSLEPFQPGFVDLDRRT
jgi:predicted phage terminase large subunit-like protein